MIASGADKDEAIKILEQKCDDSTDGSNKLVAKYEIFFEPNYKLNRFKPSQEDAEFSCFEL